MTIEKVNGDILRCPHEEDTILIPVNTVGVMGKGLALHAKLIFPEVYEFYKDLCDEGICKIGEVYPVDRKYVLEMDKVSNPQTVICFPTKDHWKNPSDIHFIERGLEDLVKFLYRSPFIERIGIPKLGCGLGGLDWNIVYPLIEKYLSPIDKIFTVYE